MTLKILHSFFPNLMQEEKTLEESSDLFFF